MHSLNVFLIPTATPAFSLAPHLLLRSIPIYSNHSHATLSTTIAVPSRRGLWRLVAAALAISLVAAPVVVLGDVAPANAAIIRPFSPVYSVNTNGNILMAANTLMTCATGSTGCAAARASTSGVGISNNDFNSEFIDVDADASTFNSSSATLTVPTSGGVLFAALVWGGRTGSTGASPANPLLRGNVRLTVPSGSGSSNVSLTASRVDVSADSAYQGYVDVTDIVAAAGSGVYTVANVQTSSGGLNQYAGWSLIVAVADPAAPARNLTVFTGFGSVETGDPPQTFSVSGFLTPPSGPVFTTLGAVTYEGDMGRAGDSFSLNGTQISDPLNPANNVFNSTISNRGVQAFGATAPFSSTPAYTNQLGFDADLFNADGILANSATSATFGLTTVADQYFPGVVTFATDLYDPRLIGTKTVVDVNGGSVVPGDVLEYTVPIENVGLDTATKSRFFDAIPTGTTFVPGSIKIDSTAQTDGSDGDNARYVAAPSGHVEAFIGIGATSTLGGSIPVTPGSTQHTVVFRVTVNAPGVNGQPLVNAASLNYRGQTTDSSQASATNAVSSVVVATPVSGNNPPAATPEVLTFTPSPGTAAVVIPVLNGDTDPENDLLTVVAVTDASGGTAVINSNGTVTYTPRADFAGRDVFTYTIQDTAGNRSTSTVRVDVINTNPVAVDDTATVPAGVTTSVPVLSNDTDANGDALTVRGVSSSSTQGGTVALVGGVVRYTSATGFRGTDTFTYVVEDTRGGFDTGLVTVTVANTVPVANPDNYATTSGTGIAVSVLGNDTDANGDTLTAIRITAPANGTVSLASNGTGNYVPNPGFRGTDSFTYRVSDGFGGTATATVTIVVNGPPDAVNDTATTAEATAVDVSVLTNDTDPDSDPLTVSITGTPTKGTATVQSGGVIRYTPNPGFAGTDTVTYQVSDGRGLTDTATVTITVLNALPVAVSDSASTPTNTPTGQIDVVANDTDVNVTAGVPGQALVVSGVPTANNGAMVVRNPNGTLTVTPATGFSGVVTVTYTLSDGAGGTASGTLSVSVANASPIATPDMATTPANTATLVDVLANDTDPNASDTLTIVPGSPTTPVDSSGLPRGTVTIVGGRLQYTPPTGFSGVVTVTYRVTDGALTSTGTLTIRVNNVAPAPRPDISTVPGSGPTTIDVLGNDTDPDGGVLTIASVTQPNHGRVAIVNNKVVYTPDSSGYAGTVTFTYTVSDGQGGLTTETVTLNVRPASLLGATGADVTGLALLALLLVTFGAGAIVIGARRREAE